MFDWWRSWHGAPTDDKWLVIAKRAGVPAIIVPAIAWALLDHASQADERGDVSSFDFEAYALKFGLEEDDVRKVYAAMEARGMIVSGRIAQWDKRQKNESTERSRKHRGKVSAPELPLDSPVAEKPSPVVDAAPPAHVEVERPDLAPEPETQAAALITPEAMALADEIAVAVGHDLQFVPPQWCGAASRVQMWLNQGWPAPFILQSAKAQMARKRDGPPVSISYFERGIAMAVARSQVPVVTVVPFPETHSRPARQANGITAAADRLIADLDAGGRETREGASRLLSDR